MLNLFNKSRFSVLLALLSLSAMSSSLMAWESCCDCDSYEGNKFYIGAFGGGIYPNSTKLTQMGTAFFTEASGGPLAVLAQGHTKRNSTGFGGAQIGYRWSQHSPCSSWTISPAAEVEAYYFRHTKRGHLTNPTDRLPEHDFKNSFHANTTVCLVNAVFSLNSSCLSGFIPYIGGGIGAAHISLRKAESLQVDPPEVGVNHFNSKRNDTSWAFAAQAKAGIRYKIWGSFHVFGEYRYLFVDSSNYIFGSTVYPTHAPTSPWNIKLKNNSSNAFAIGIQYDLY